MSDQFQGIQVSGVGKVAVSPNQARISLGVRSDAKHAAQALAANSKKMQEVFKSLQAAGVEPKDMQTSQLSISPTYSYPKNKPPTLTGYNAANTLTVKVHKMDTIGAIVDAAVQAGVNNIDNIAFESDNDDVQTKKALQQALANAKSKAELIAAAENVVLGGLFSLVEEGIQYPNRPLMRFAAQSDAGGAAPIAPGELQLTATVTAVYRINVGA